MKLPRRLCAVLVSALVVAGAAVAAAPAHAAAGDIHVYPDLGPMAGPSRVVETPDGSVWVAELLGGYLHRYDSSGTHLDAFGPFGFAGGADMTLGPDGNLWITQDRSIAVYSTGGAFVRAYDLHGASPAGKDLLPGSIVTSGGRVWFTAGNNLVAGMDPAGALTFVTVPNIVVLSAGPDGRIWTAEVSVDQVGFIDPVLGTYTRIMSPAPLYGKISATRDGSVWAPDLAGHVYRLTFPLGTPTWTTYATPDGFVAEDVAVDADGTAWVGLQSEKLMAITSGGVVDTFGPTKGLPERLTVVGGRVWFSGGERLVGSMELLDSPALTACPTSTAQAGVAYDSGPLATTGSGVKRFSLSAGTVPGGLTLDTTTGAITGVPTVVGTTMFTLRVTSSLGRIEKSYDRACTMTIAPSPIVAPFLPPLVETAPAVVGSAYSASVTATGDEPMSITVTAGSPPPGVTVSVSGRVATFTGTPTTAGTYSVQLTASNAAGSYTTAYEIVVGAAPAGQAPALDALTGGSPVVVGRTYSGSVHVTGDQPIAVALTAGSLPPGLTMVVRGGTVTMSGTPISVGTFDFDLTATNASGTDTRSYRIVVVGPGPGPGGGGGAGGTGPGNPGNPGIGAGASGASGGLGQGAGATAGPGRLASTGVGAEGTNPAASLAAGAIAALFALAGGALLADDRLRRRAGRRMR